MPLSVQVTRLCQTQVAHSAVWQFREIALSSEANSTTPHGTRVKWMAWPARIVWAQNGDKLRPSLGRFISMDRLCHLGTVVLLVVFLFTDLTAAENGVDVKE